MSAHSHFDPIWELGYMERGEAYLWLCVVMDKVVDNCHIAQFTLEECRKVVRESFKKLEELQQEKGLP